MKDLQKSAATELIEFLSSYDLGATLQQAELRAKLTRCFKRYYPLLLLERRLSLRAPWNDAGKNDTFRTYFRESISDICQAIILAAQGLYKPAQLSLRCGLENWMRCIGLAEDQNVLALKSVYELIELVNASGRIKNDPLAKQYFQTLRHRYSLLCGYVHTSSASHMALTTVAGAYPRYLDHEADATFQAVEEVSSRITYLFCLLAEKTYRSLHHTHFDIVSDALPRKLKAHLNRKKNL